MTESQIYTIAGCVLFKSSYVRLLMGVDGIMFVTDSNEERLHENSAYLTKLEMIISSLGRDSATVPILLQYNKRDLANAASLSSLNARLNQRQWPTVESVALQGQGVLEAFTVIRKLLGYP